MRRFAEIRPDALILSVLEKREHVPRIRFDIIMFLHGGLQPESLCLVNKDIYAFLIESFMIIVDKEFVVDKDGMIMVVNT